MKTKINLDGVQETLLITLYYRYLDAKSKNPKINDEHAVKIIESIDYDFKKFRSDWPSLYGIIARVVNIDRLTREFIKKHPKANIISIGSGLDSRFYRIDNGSIKWYNIDFPDVIALREKLFEKNSRVKDIALSCLDKAWVLEIERNDEPYLFISEGVSCYLTYEENKDFFAILCDNFKDFHLIYDTVSAHIVKAGKTSQSVSKTKAKYYWGTTDEHTIPDMEERLENIVYINNNDEMKKYLKFYQKIFNPILHRFNNRIVYLKRK